MRYDLSKTEELQQALDYLGKLSGREAIVNITKVNPPRSGQQNKYFHSILGIFGIETGFTAEEAKTIFKRNVNPDIFVYERNDIKFLKSSADLTTVEMTKAIDRFREYAGEQGIEIPLPNDEEALRYWGNEIEKQGKYL